MRELAGVFELPGRVTQVHAWNRRLGRMFGFRSLQWAAALRLINSVAENASADYQVVEVRKTRGLLPITYVQNGWYQDHHVAQSLRARLPPIRDSLLDAARVWHGKNAESSRPTVFCHLRRTDYATHLGGVMLPLAYYEHAIQRLRPDPD